MRLAIEKPKRRISSLWAIFDQLKRGMIKLDAPYQRDIVWSQAKMSMLIDSALNNYYIPPLIFSVRATEEGYIRYCIDGKQRLSSIWKFMRNEIPYLDESNDRAENIYFDPTATQDVLEGATNRKYLSDAEREQFSDLELVMIEYNNLAEDEELEIFSRVQMGVALTFGEKLYAYNSQAARFCKELTETYSLKGILGSVNRGNSLRTISQLVYMLYESSISGMNTYTATPQNLLKFLKDTSIQLTDTFKKRIIAIFKIYDSIANNAQGEKALNYVTHSKKQKLPVMQFIIFGIYIYQHQKKYDLKTYISDLQHLRAYFDTNYSANIMIGNPCYQQGLKWMEIIQKKHQEESQQINSNNISNSNSISFSTLSSTPISIPPSTTIVPVPFATTSTSSSVSRTVQRHLKSNNNKKRNNPSNILVDSSDDDDDDNGEDLDEIEDDSDDNIVYSNNHNHKYNRNIHNHSHSSIRFETDTSSKINEASPPLKRLKTAHNNRSALNRELKISDSPPSNSSRSSMGQTSRSGQPMARRGGHRK